MTVPTCSRRRLLFDRGLFIVYAAWCVVAVVEIVGRKATGASPFPGFLANHSGNIAVSGFIVPVGLAAAALRRRLARGPGGTESALTRWLPVTLVSIASAGWTTYFVLLELFPIYASNVTDVADLPGSIFGAFVGSYAAFRALEMRTGSDGSPPPGAASRHDAPGTLDSGSDG